MQVVNCCSIGDQRYCNTLVKKKFAFQKQIFQKRFTFKLISREIANHDILISLNNKRALYFWQYKNFIYSYQCYLNTPLHPPQHKLFCLEPAGKKQLLYQTQTFNTSTELNCWKSYETGKLWNFKVMRLESFSRKAWKVSLFIRYMLYNVENSFFLGLVSPKVS